jgi:FkbM family methyltransferase
MGFVVVRTSHTGVRYLDNPPSGAFDQILLRVFENLDGLRFIQVGANDGIRADPIHRMVRLHRWRGVFVEPLPIYFEQLCRNYAGLPDLQFVNAAVDLEPGTRRIYQLRPNLDVPDWAHGLPTFDLTRLQTVARTLGLSDTDIVSEEVRAVTWDDIRTTFGDHPCDVLVVDAEGYDITLLRAANLDRWKPRVILFEHGCATEADRLAFYGELIRAGYEISSEAQDTAAWLRPPVP